ncbi:O-antigen ligase family protein [Hyphococcus sp.]|uniref:O-antigen ligase family protein n=1 Tax=Hyphococcus sp. TaxID=2038636 RepID=UPI003CCBA012
MGPHFKAFIAVFIVSTVALFFLRQGFAPLIGQKRATHWSATWLIMTSLAFLLTNYWMFIIVAGIAAFGLSRAEPVRPAIYILLLSFVPTLGEAIPGFAGINKFIEVNPQLAILFVVLLPLMFSGAAMKKLNKVGVKADLFFLLFLILQIILSVRAPSFTHMLRTALHEFLLIAPIYYVMSRYPKSFSDMRILSAALVFPAIVLSAVSIPEFLRNWHFYNSVSTNWFGAMPFGYTMREGYLRASTSVFNPIVWGYIAMCGLGIGIAVLNDKISNFYKYAGIALLGVGLIVSLSRGPWIGAVVVLGVYVLLSPNVVTRSMQAAVGGVAALAISLMTPFGKDIISLIPFVGGERDATVTYRQKLLENAWQVILEHPFIGSADFMAHSALQSLRQGQGIIDIVNTYLQIGLKSGLTGLILFLGFFLCVLSSLLKVHKRAKKADPVMANYCRAYIATICGVLLTIFTTSSVGQIPYLYWSLGGLGIALARVVHQQLDSGVTQTTVPAASSAAEEFAWK